MHAFTHLDVSPPCCKVKIVCNARSECESAAFYQSRYLSNDGSDSFSGQRYTWRSEGECVEVGKSLLFVQSPSVSMETIEARHGQLSGAELQCTEALFQHGSPNAPTLVARRKA